MTDKEKELMEYLSFFMSMSTLDTKHIDMKSTEEWENAYKLLNLHCQNRLDKLLTDQHEQWNRMKMIGALFGVNPDV